jgi:hypothetical protein
MDRPLRQSRHLTAAGILAIGWTAAFALSLTPPPVEKNPDLVDLQESKVYARQLQVIGGKAAVAGAQLETRVADAWRSNGLAWSVALGTAVAAVGYWVWSGRERTRPGSGRGA